MRRLQCIVVLVGAALAAGFSPAAATARGQAGPRVLYVIKGKVTQFIPAGDQAIGSVTMLVTGSNRQARLLQGMRVTFGIGAGTRLAVGADGEIAVGDRGVVKVRAPKRLSAATLRSLMALQVIAPGKPQPSGGGEEGTGQERSGGSRPTASPKP
jgi:hypothetical protein